MKKSATSIKSGLVPVKFRLNEAGDDVVQDAQRMLKAYDELLKSIAPGGKFCFDESCKCEVLVTKKSYYDQWPTDCYGTGKNGKH